MSARALGPGALAVAGGGLLIGLLGWYALIVGAPTWAALGLAVLPPMVLTRRWSRTGRARGWSWFVWTKMISVVLLACCMLAGRGAHPGGPVAVVVYGLLVVNILEAGLKDAQSGLWANAAAAVCLALATPGPAAFSPGDAAVRFDVGWPWIAAYTVWNLAFVYGQNPRVYGQHLAVLGAPVLVALAAGPERWLAARVFTLLGFLFAYMTAYGFFWDRFDMARWHADRVARGLAVASLLACGGALALAP